MLNNKKNPLEPGRAVQVTGIRSKPEMNGTFGMVLEYNEAKKRWKVALEMNGGLPSMLQDENLIPLDELLQFSGETEERSGDATGSGESADTADKDKVLKNSTDLDVVRSKKSGKTVQVLSKYVRGRESRARSLYNST